LKKYGGGDGLHLFSIYSRISCGVPSYELQELLLIRRFAHNTHAVSLSWIETFS
jgi:hypothetical protein